MVLTVFRCYGPLQLGHVTTLQFRAIFDAIFVRCSWSYFEHQQRNPHMNTSWILPHSYRFVLSGHNFKKLRTDRGWPNESSKAGGLVNKTICRCCCRCLEFMGCWELYDLFVSRGRMKRVRMTGFTRFADFCDEFVDGRKTSQNHSF